MSGFISICAGVVEDAKVNDNNGQEYASMTHDEATKNHPRGIEDVNSVEK